MISFDKITSAFEDAGLIVQSKGHGKAAAQAPGHTPADRSVTITHMGDQSLFWCHTEPREEVFATLGLTWPDDLYDNPRGVEYKYDDGRVVRKSPQKKFSQGGNTKGTSLYHVELIGDAKVVYVGEGEQDVQALESLGATAVSGAMGSGKAHLFDWTPLYGRTVIIVADKDDAGELHAKQVQEQLDGHADTMVVHALEGKDATDHVAAGHGLDEFVPVYPPMPEGPVRLDQMVDEWWDWLNTPPGSIRLFPSPWEHWNDATSGGFHPKRVYIFAGRPASGKTLGVLNIAAHAAEQGHPTLVFSIEMPRLEVTSRIMSSGAEASYSQITRRQVEDFHLRRLHLYHEGRVNDTELWLHDESSITIEDILLMARQMKASEVGLDIVVIDHVGLVKPSGERTHSRQQQLHHISWQASQMAKELDIAVVIAAQLNRGPESSNERPKKSDLRESGDLENNADVITLLHHEKLDGMPSGEIELIIDKNRTGNAMTITLPYRPHIATLG